MMVIVDIALGKSFLKGYLLKASAQIPVPFLESDLFVAGCTFLTYDINDKRIE